MSIQKKVLTTAITSGLAALMGVPAHAENGNATNGAQLRAIEEVVVTARRREESAQSTPVAVSVMDSESLYRENITEIKDLTASIAGVNFTQSGGANNTVFNIRGRSRGVVGNAQPAVASYVNDIPLNTWGASIPTYDMASIQVLKGPQGTLFGRNTVSGALLTTTQGPDYDLGGYVLARAGQYNARVLEGAINIPVLEDKIALRIAGQTDRRDGFTQNITNPQDEDFDNRHRDNWRVSLLVEPTADLSNLTVYENNRIDEQMANSIPLGYEPGTGFVDLVYPGQIGPIIERQEQAGVRKAWADAPTFIKTELESISNTTTLDLGAVTLKNIFGYKEVFTRNVSDIDGTELPIINADSLIDVKQYSNEFQIAGDTLDGYMEYIAGVFWLKSEPNGPQRLALQLFNPAGTPFEATASGPSDYFTDETTAVFGQVSYELSHLNDELEAFSVDLGVRYTEDETEVCGIPATSYAVPIPGPEDCLSTDAASEDFSKTTYSLGLNYQPSEDLLLYAVTRSGYKAGGLNSPKFGGLLVPYQSYEPETVQDYEIGLKSDWAFAGMVGRLNLALYKSDYEDIQVAIPTSGASDIDGDGNPANDPSGTTFYVNAGEASVDGVEIELVVGLTDSLELTLAGSKLDKDLDEDVALPATLPPSIASGEGLEPFVFLGAPDWSYTAGLDYLVPFVPVEFGEVQLSANYFRISDIHYGGNVYASDYETVDFRADWFGVMGSPVDLAVYMTNAFDEEAIIGPSSSSEGVGVNAGIYNDPRMFGASIRYQF